MTHSEFRISVGDDQEHDDLTAEIYFRDQFVAVVSQERGLENAEIELHAQSSGEAWSFKLQDFLDVLEQARQRLWDLRRVPQPD